MIKDNILVYFAYAHLAFWLTVAPLTTATGGNTIYDNAAYASWSLKKSPAVIEV